MMSNKWCQATVLLGVCIGCWFGVILSFIHVYIPLFLAVGAGFASMWIGANARGTDGWGGPYNGPPSENAKPETERNR